jgi:type I restriction-modification system DNA methylase subunit
MDTLFEQHLEHFDFKFDFEFKVAEPALLLTNRTYGPSEISFGSRLVLEDARRLSATAVYLRHTQANSSPQPQVFIYDNTFQQFTETQLADIHRKIWSSDIVSVYYVVERTQVKVFDARKSVDFEGERMVVKPFETLEVVAEAQEAYQKYSAKLFENGAFWEQAEHLDKFLHNHGSSKRLISELKSFRDTFVAENQDSRELIRKLLVQSILVKYLEERRDESEKRVFEESYFAQFDGAKNFCDVIRYGKIVAFLSSLSGHFNGKIFELTADEIAQINSLNLTRLADFLDAKLVNGQYSFWRLYAFDYVPVEVISRIYEEFIPERADAVYTPAHLAQLMIDESMPLETPEPNFKVIDVSCGSGIFLVLAFKRLVQWWQKQKYEQEGKIMPPQVDTLQSLLRESIYGVDIEKGSVRLTMFSLSLALCDMLSPTEIWLKLRFDNLEENNLVHIDFFEFLHTRGESKFDLVIGNPPFEGSSNEVSQVIKKYKLDLEVSIPQKQIALLFLREAMRLLRSGGLLCLVLPVGPVLYNNNSLDYRKDFFSKYEVPQILDLSTLSARGHLFESAVATAVIFAKNQIPKSGHTILHIAVKRTKSAKDKRFFEIDHYDLHYVPLEIAVSDSIVWKTNLFGGGQLYYLVRRLIDSRSLGDFLEKKRNTTKRNPKPDKWMFGEGYIVGEGVQEASHITGKHSVEAENFQESGIRKITIETETKFHRPKNTRDKNLIFEPPHLLIREVLGNNSFIIAYSDEYLVFKHQIIGIHAPRNEISELKRLESYLRNNYNLLKMLLLSFSSRAGISKSFSTLLMKDFMLLPFPDDDSILELSKNEEIIVQDVLQYGLDLLKKGEQAIANRTKPSAEQLFEFGDVFCQNLNTIYQANGNAFRPLEPIEGTAYICCPFFYGSNKQPNISHPDLLNGLDILLRDKRKAIEFYRVVYHYQNDIVYLIKPKTLKYWLKSVALRDATEVIQDLIASGY